MITDLTNYLLNFDHCNKFVLISGPPLTKPEIVMKGKEFVEMGEQIRLSCKASGGPHIPEEMDWFKDGDKIDMRKYKHMLITKYRSLEDRALVSELLIDRSRIHDSGTYICRSSSDKIDSIKVTVLVGECNLGLRLIWDLV